MTYTMGTCWEHEVHACLHVHASARECNWKKFVAAQVTHYDFQELTPGNGLGFIQPDVGMYLNSSAAATDPCFQVLPQCQIKPQR